MPPHPSVFSAPSMALAALLLAATFALVFLAAHRRHPHVPGPGWWSLAGLLATASFGGLIYRFAHQGESYVGLANATLLVAVLLCWLGVRAHLGRTTRLGWIWLFAAVMVAVNAILSWQPEARALRQLFFMLVTGGLTLATLRDLLAPALPNGGNTRLLLALSVGELLALLGAGLELLPVARSVPLTFEDGEAGIIMAAFFLFSLLRLVIYLLLVFQRLQAHAHQAQDSLRQREALTWDMLEGLRAGVLALDVDGSVLRANALASTWLRLVPAPAYNGTRLQVSTSGWVDEGGLPLAPLMAPHQRVLADPSVPVKDGVVGIPGKEPAAWRWLLCKAYMARGNAAGSAPVVLTLVDVTAVRMAQEQEREQQRRQWQTQKMEALGSLASGVAHDFNNVLAAIRGYISLLQAGPATPDELTHALGQMAKAAGKGRDLVRRILAFGRQQGVNRQLVNVPELLDDTAALLQVLRRPEVTLSVQYPPRLAPVLGDLTQLSQVLLNLGTNAIQAIGQGRGVVEIMAEEHPVEDLAAALPSEVQAARMSAPLALRWVRMGVHDNGCGMDETTQARVFEPYFTTKPAGQGTGLGLPTVQDIVRAHGGFIVLRSAPGAGTRFSVWLPAADTGSSTFPPQQP